MNTDTITTSTNKQPPEIHRGEIWHINEGQTTSTGCEMWSNRPAIIISNDVTCSKANFVEVVYLTTQFKKPLPTHICVQSGNRQAIALCEQIFPVDKTRIGFYIGKINDDEMKEVEKALLFSLGISNTVKPSTLFKKWTNAVLRYGIDINSDENESTASAPSSIPAYNINMILSEYESKVKFETEQTMSKLRNVCL